MIQIPGFPQIFVLLVLLQATLAANDTNSTNTTNNTNWITINATNPSVGPNLNIHLNMSGIGTFKIYSMSSNGHANENTIATLHSKWMQYDTNKTLYITIGDESLNDPICWATFYFVAGKHYSISYNNSNCSQPVCSCISGYGYVEETSRYNSTFLGYVGRSYSYKFNTEIDSFAGRVLDGVGPLTILLHARVSDGAYLGMTTIEARNITGVNASIPYYNEYFYYDNNRTVPDAKYGVVPQMCLDYEKKNNCSAYPFDWNGIPIVEASNSTANNSKNTNSGMKLAYLFEMFAIVIFGVVLA